MLESHYGGGRPVASGASFLFGHCQEQALMMHFVSVEALVWSGLVCRYHVQKWLYKSIHTHVACVINDPKILILDMHACSHLL